MSAKRYKIIANPVAGSGSGRRAIPRIERLLTDQALDFDIVPTERPWHAAELAQESGAAGYDVVVAAGGDGTSNEVINGLMAAKQMGKYIARLIKPMGIRTTRIAQGLPMGAAIELADQSTLARALSGRSDV